MQSGGVEHVGASLHCVRTRFNSNVKQDCTGDFAAQRVDLRTVLAFIKANMASHGPKSVVQKGVGPVGTFAGSLTRIEPDWSGFSGPWTASKSKCWWSQSNATRKQGTPPESGRGP